MRDQILRIVLGLLFLGGSLWANLGTKMAVAPFLTTYILGALLLFRALPFSFWKR